MIDFRLRRFLPLLVGGLVLAGLGRGGFEAGATRWTPLTIEQLAARAEWIVRGKVTAIEVARDADGRLFTRIEGTVQESWKGSGKPAPEGRCTWVAGGGTLGTRIEGAEVQAQYRVGESLVVFLVRNPAGEWVTVGLSQGRFEIHSDGAGASWVRNPFWGEEAGSVPGAERTGAPTVRLPSRRPLSLDELRRRIREATE